MLLLSSESLNLIVKSLEYCILEIELYKAVGDSATALRCPDYINYISTCVSSQFFGVLYP